MPPPRIYTKEIIQERLNKVKPHITILEYCETYNGYSKFKCSCLYEWVAPVGRILSIRQRNRKSCPVCCKENQKRKPQISKEEKVSRQKYRGSYKYKCSRPNFHEKRRKRENLRRKNDINFKLACVSRNQIRRIIKLCGLLKIKSTWEYNKYSVLELKSHIESQFTGEMSWGNHGILWEIDHIRPIADFIKRGEIDISKINALNNLQPLLKEENRAKSDKYEAFIS